MNDTIYRQDAIDAMEQAKEQYFDRRVIIGKMQDIVSNLPSTQLQSITCDGCKYVGTYDTDFPCSSCIRREKDYYAPEE